jgi:hypothetical protein
MQILVLLKNLYAETNSVYHLENFAIILFDEY